MSEWARSIPGVLLGTAVGDSLGLPREGLSPQRAAALFGPDPLAHGFWFRRGVVSDDTEQTCLAAVALYRSSTPEEFARRLAHGLRGWFSALPPGIGLATAKACLKLCCGLGPRRSGVASAGNGAAMRAAVIGVMLGPIPDLRAWCEAASRVTHTDPRAVEGAYLVALAAAHSEEPPDVVMRLVAEAASEPSLEAAVRTTARLFDEGATLDEVVRLLDARDGVSGFVVPTVAASLYCALRWAEDYRTAVATAVGLGGDTDTVGAITGALVGARLGPEAIPAEWCDGLADWPLGRGYLTSLGLLLRRKRKPGRPPRLPRLPWAFRLARNLLVLLWVLGHGLRRLRSTSRPGGP